MGWLYVCRTEAALFHAELLWVDQRGKKRLVRVLMANPFLPNQTLAGYMWVIRVGYHA
jgi:hypothetical protein